MRRNLLVHSLHLQPIAPDDDSDFGDGEKTDSDTVFTSQFNHIDHAHREKLRPRDLNGEVILLVGQLNKAGDPNFNPGQYGIEAAQMGVVK
jgi:hypothetical protein